MSTFSKASRVLLPMGVSIVALTEYTIPESLSPLRGGSQEKRF